MRGSFIFNTALFKLTLKYLHYIKDGEGGGHTSFEVSLFGGGGY